MSQKTLKQDSGKFSLKLKLIFPSREIARIVEKAILPEVNAPHARRSNTSIGIKNTIISINIKAADAVAMRAGLNSCLNSIILAKSITEV